VATDTNAYKLLIVQPDDGVTPLVQAIDGALESIDILIFRFDRRELEAAIVRAVQRGVHVRALIAHTSKGGEKSLRALELRMLKAGVTVCRTAEDLLRYHGKMMIVDRKELFVLGFNFSYIDMDRSRSFGIVTLDKSLVDEAAKLFDADSARKEYVPAHNRFLVSPLNARTQLAEFLKGAKRELLFYDPNISDKQMLRILEERAKDGVAIRAIGYSPRLAARQLLEPRLHVRLILRDEASVFLGSQSLRASELDRRREVGLIIDDADLAATLKSTFEKDWSASEPVPGFVDAPVSANKIAKRVAKAVTRELPPLEPVFEEVMKEVGVEELAIQPDWSDLQSTVEDAVKRAVKEAVRNAVEGGGGGGGGAA
jgi:phosphatidylserine/phosphatidylglycerophosphate/cardiolipin synthase-like enzyme